MRIRMNLGNEAEKSAAEAVGTELAHRLRTDNGVGWHGTVSDYGGCSPRDSN